jgi:4-oxalocrotonate tautomerase
MPHITMKLYPGKSEEQKVVIADAITQALIGTGHWGPDAISIGIEDVAPDAWVERVYKPEVIEKPETLYKKPGYNPLA